MQRTERVLFRKDAREKPQVCCERFSSEKREVHPGAGLQSVVENCR